MLLASIFPRIFQRFRLPFWASLGKPFARIFSAKMKKAYTEREKLRLKTGYKKKTERAKKYIALGEFLVQKNCRSLLDEFDLQQLMEPKDLNSFTTPKAPVASKVGECSSRASEDIETTAQITVKP